MVCQARMVSQNNLTNDATNQKKGIVKMISRLTLLSYKFDIF